MLSCTGAKISVRQFYHESNSIIKFAPIVVCVCVCVVHSNIDVYWLLFCAEHKNSKVKTAHTYTILLEQCCIGLLHMHFAEIRNIHFLCAGVSLCWCFGSLMIFSAGYSLAGCLGRKRRSSFAAKLCNNFLLFLCAGFYTSAHFHRFECEAIMCMAQSKLY